MSSSNETGDFLARHGATLIDNGYEIVPIKPGRKSPTINGWEDVRSTKAHLQKWLANGHATAGVGIATKHTPAIDFDIYDRDVVDRMVEFTRDNLGDAPIRVGRAPKALMLYSTDKPFTKVMSARWKSPDGKINRVEVLGEGQQFVAYHIHPDTGRPFEWLTEDDPLNTTPIDLEPIDVRHAQAVCREFDRLAQELGWERVGNSSEYRDAAASADADDVLAELPPPEETEEEVNRVRSALEAIDADCDYDTWRNVVFGLKSTRWECAEELAREWSQKYDGFKEREFKTLWKSGDKREKRSRVTIATVIEYAKKAGWDASRKPTAQEQGDAADTIMAEVQAIASLTEGRSEAITAVITKIAKADLTASLEERLLKALKDVAKVGLTALRKDVREAKRAATGDKATHASYARLLITMLEEKTTVPPVGVESMIYTYSRKEGIWNGRLAEDYEVDVARAFDARENCERRTDYLAIAKHAYALCARGNEEFFVEAPIGLACKGRFYSIDDDGEITREALTAEHRQRVLSPVRPVKGDMPLFEKFLEQTFEGDQNDEQINLLQEIIGAIYLGVLYKFEKAVLFKGEGRAGKGTLQRIISAMVAKTATCAVSPFRWDSEYYIGTLAGKRLNLVGELPQDEPIPAAHFKTVTGRDPLTGRHPGSKPFAFQSQAAHLFSTNHFIHTKDHSEAFYSRWLLLEFRNSRIGMEGGIDSNLAERIIENELPAIAAWALQGAKRLLDRGFFEITQVHERMLAQWKQRTSSLLEFLLDRDECTLGDAKKHGVRRSVFYERYATWCRVSNRRPLGKQRLYDDLRSATIAKLGVRLGTDHTGADIIRGVSISAWDAGAFEVDDDL